MYWGKAKRINIFVLLLVLVVSAVLPSNIAQAANQILTVDISSNTGNIHYGATGFLYGLGDDGIPTDAVLKPLRPRVAAQMPQGGAQHPDGGAFDVAPQFFLAGGDNIEIYMQDIYAQWPYEDLGLTDYLDKVDSIARGVVANPNREKFVYVPFNEPDQIWYGSDITRLCTDWKIVYDKIRSIDPTARIAGLNYATYNNGNYSQFLSYAKANNCLPDVTTWHELGDDFFSGWYDHYNNYRAIEQNLGISQIPICINEYGRFSGDLGYPGNMVQWIARFENSKVDGCRAYWGAAGNLDELITENNKVNGDWWLYKWYGELTGSTVTVTPPTLTGPLQGVASLDDSKKQMRLLFGGSLNSDDVFNSDIVVKGLNTSSDFGSTVHVTVMGVDATLKDEITGFVASDGPYVLQEGDYSVLNNQIIVTVENMKALSAYQMIVTPNTDANSAYIAGRYEAEYAELAGPTNISTYEADYSGTGYVQGFGESDEASVTYVTSVVDNGYYDINLRYSAGPYGGAPTLRYVRMLVNGTYHKTLQTSQTATWGTWSDVSTTVYLQGGINLITFSAYTNDESDCVNQDYMDVSAGIGIVDTYEAESAVNSLEGAAVISGSTNASGGYKVGYIGNGGENTLQFNNVNATSAGTYKLIIQYTNAEKIGDHAYNTNVVDRTLDIVINGQLQKSGLHCRNTFSWDNFDTTVVDVTLNEGNNTIRFSNSNAYAPDIDKISIAKP